MQDKRTPAEKWDDRDKQRASRLTDATDGGIADRESWWPKKPQPLCEQRGKQESGPLLSEDPKDKKPRRQPLGDNLESTLLRPKITECEFVASYNWVDSQTPTILVPGAPPKWTPLSKPRELNRENRNYYRDPDAARWPTYPMEPSVRALFEMHPDFDTKSINIMACATSLRSILTFAESRKWAFDLEVEMIGNTLFINRKALDPCACVSNVSSHLRTFQKTYTTWDPLLKGSSVNLRLVRYNFGGMTMLIRYGCDGYLGHKVPEVDDKLVRDGLASPRKEDNANDLVTMVQSGNVGKASVEQERPLVVKRPELAIPQRAVSELRSRPFSEAKDLKNILEENMYRLWIRQVPNLTLGFHENGIFNDIQNLDVRDDVKDWETREEKTLQIFAGVIQILIEKTKALGPGKFLVHRDGMGPLEIRRIADNVKHMLPDELIKKWSGVAEHSDKKSEANHENPDELRARVLGDRERASEVPEDNVENLGRIELEVAERLNTC